MSVSVHKMARWLLVAGCVGFGVVVAAAEPAFAQGSCQLSPGGSCPAPGQSSVPDPTTLIGAHPPATVGKNLTGRGTLTLASLLGKPTAVVFWLNTCPHCRATLPVINRLRTYLGPSSQIVTAAIDAGLEGPRGFTTPAAAARTLRLKLPTILVANDVAQKEWKVAATPTAYIIDSRRVITAVLQPRDSNNLANEIRTALAHTS